MRSTKRKLQTGGVSSGPGTPVTRRDSDGDDEDYRKKRERNNLAVKRSRAKAKTRTTETEKRVNDERMQNQRLEGKIRSSKKHTIILKDLLKAHASTKSEITEDDLRQILEDCSDNEDDEVEDPDEGDEVDEGDACNKSYNVRNVKSSSTVKTKRSKYYTQ